MTVAAPLGQPRHHFDEVDSTNDEAKRRAADGAPHGTTVTAGHQTSGRGRQGRPWFAPAGQTVTVSVILRDLPYPMRLPLAAAVAVAETVGEGALIKWPNDIVFVGEPAAAGAEPGGMLTAGGQLRKVAGILCEAQPAQGWAVVGVGLNVALDLSQVPPDIAAKAATMGRSPDEFEAVLADLLRNLEAALALPFETLLEAWSARDVLLGETVRWGIAGSRQGAGVAEGVDADGRLQVRGEHGLERLDAGEVHLTAAEPSR